jgi:hypothetical protein
LWKQGRWSNAVFSDKALMCTELLHIRFVRTVRWRIIFF